MVLFYSEKLPEGWEAGEFKLKEADGGVKILADFVGKKGLLIVFTCNHCPYAKASWPVLVGLHKKYGEEIEFVAINPNDPDTYPEDSFEKMGEEKKRWDVKFAYLQDQTQEVAKIYKAQCTPDPYLFKVENDKAKLFYHGRINSNWQSPEQAEEHNLEDATKLLLENKPFPKNQPPSMGCSIKWKT